MKAVINNLMKQINALQEMRVELEKNYDNEKQWIKDAFRKGLDNTNEQEFNAHVFAKDTLGSRIYRLTLAINDLYNTVSRLENINA